jgi:uncharacterized protein (TIGR03435 family)
MTRALAGAGFVALSLGALGQPASERLAFEVASVRLNNTDVQPSVGPAPGGQRFMARNMPLNWLIAMAYGVSIRQISLPRPFDAERYDIEAKAERPASRAQMTRMLRTLIEERSI